MLELYTTCTWNKWEHGWDGASERKGKLQNMNDDDRLCKNMFSIQVSHLLSHHVSLQVYCTWHLCHHEVPLNSMLNLSAFSWLDHSYLVTFIPHNPTSFLALLLHHGKKSEHPSILQVGSPCACKALQCWMAGQAHSKLLNHLGESIEWWNCGTIYF